METNWARSFADNAQRLGDYWLRLTYLPQCLIVFILFFVKNGIGISSENIVGAYLPSSINLPRPLSYFSASLGNGLLAKLIGVDDLRSWIFLHVALILLALVLTLVLIRSQADFPPGVLLLLVVAFPASSILVANVGMYDVFTYAGAVLIGLSSYRSMRIVGVFTMALGNPEQTLLAMICLFFVAMIPKFVELKSTVYWGLGISVFWLSTVQLWMIFGGVVSNRFTMLPYFLGLSFSNFFISPMNSLWSWYGISWLVVIAIFSHVRGQSKWKLGVALVAIPAAATLVTADGVRVFSLIALPAYLTVIRFSLKHQVHSQHFSKAVGIFLLLWGMIPSSSTGGVIFEFIDSVIQNPLLSLSTFSESVGEWLASKIE